MKINFIKINLFTIISILFLFSMSSCKKHHQNNLNYIKVSEVDIVNNLNKDLNILDLFIITSSDISDISVLPTEKMQRVNLYKKHNIKLFYDNESYDGYLYQLTIYLVKQPLIITTIDVKSPNMVVKCEIGRFQSIYLKSDDSLTSTIYEVPNENEKYLLQTTIYNDSYEKLYLNNVSTYQKNMNYKMEKDNLNKASSVIYSNGLSKYNDIVLVNNKSLYQIQGILTFEFLSNLESKKVFASYYINNTKLLDDIINSGYKINRA